ncbi:hypothetical protein [Saccharopolyspora antimicrobica]|uniref:hypothetical protein n=1 Tax=Saccharopolyspora antimicrobica TaxID=455193 RepID=UPI001160C85A|nr:hypothetical protein [Saccharopolyspora antimicrobica]
MLRPDTLAGPCGLTDATGRTSPGMAALCRSIGARDIVSGLAMTFAPGPDPLRLAVVARVAADLGDALLLDRLRSEHPARDVATLAAGRGALSALSGLTIRSEPVEEEDVAPVAEGARCECRAAPHTSPLRRWVSGIVDEELRETGVLD